MDRETHQCTFILVFQVLQTVRLSSCCPGFFASRRAPPSKCVPESFQLRDQLSTIIDPLVRSPEFEIQQQGDHQDQHARNNSRPNARSV